MKETRIAWFTPMFAAPAFVAQTDSLLYRRMAFCGTHLEFRASFNFEQRRLPIGDTAGCQPALRFLSLT